MTGSLMDHHDPCKLEISWTPILTSAWLLKKVCSVAKNELRSFATVNRKGRRRKSRADCLDNFYNPLPIIVPLQACNKPLGDYLLTDSTAWRYSPIFVLVRVALDRVNLFTFGQPKALPSILFLWYFTPCVSSHWWLTWVDMARQVDDFAISLSVLID